MAALCRWLVSRPDGKALILTAGDQDVAALARALEPFASAGSFTVETAGKDSGSVDASARVLLAPLQTMLNRAQSGRIDASVYGLVLVPDMDAVVDLGLAASLVSITACLMPQEQRSTLAVSQRFGHTERMLAKEIAGDPQKLFLNDEGESSKAAPSRSWFVDATDKLPLLLGLLAKDTARPVAAFCNLKDSAMELVRRLQENGHKAECVFGSGQRRDAIFGDARSGRVAVLVLIDEGARGLQAAWAGRVFNWDIPLEGELYVQRLAALDQKRNGASVFNFVCERYALGLADVERVLGHALTVEAVDRSMFVAENKSMSQPVSQLAQTRAHDGRSRPVDKYPADKRAADKRDDGGRYDGRNAQSIQADIAALTGANPRLSQSRDSASAVRSAQPKQEAATKPAAKHSRKARNKGGNPSAAQNRGQAPEEIKRQEQQRQASGRARQDQRPASARPDPYALPMEERMKLYRERYGKSSLPRKAQPKQALETGTAEPAKAGDDEDSGSQGLLGSIRNLFGKRR